MDRTRFVLGIAALALTATFTACSQGSSPVSPSADSPSAQLQPQAAVNQDLAAVRQATAAFHDVDTAIAAGYGDPAEVPCVASPDGTMGHHAANPALTGNQALIATQPEVLLYIKSGNGFRLTGVEYVQAVLFRNTNVTPNTVGPLFGAAVPAGWVVVNPAPSLFGQTFQGPMPGHEPGMPWHYDLHVWLWAPNPSGMFAQWNPSLSCS